MTVRPAALKVLWPETYSGKPGVTTLVAWYGSQFSPRTLPEPLPGPFQDVISWPLYRSRIAVVGRTQSNWYFAAQAEMLASISALPITKKSLTSWSSVFLRIRDRAWAKSISWPGGNSDFGPSAQYSAFIFATSDRFDVSESAVSISAAESVPSAFIGGPGSWNTTAPCLG